MCITNRDSQFLSQIGHHSLCDDGISFEKIVADGAENAASIVEKTKAELSQVPLSHLTLNLIL